MRLCQSGRSVGLPTAAAAVEDAGAAGTGIADLATGAGTLALDAERAVLIDGADGAEGVIGEGAEPPPPLLLFPGRKANMRNKVMAKPVCSSGASDKSGRLVIVI